MIHVGNGVYISEATPSTGPDVVVRFLKTHSGLRITASTFFPREIRNHDGKLNLEYDCLMIVTEPKGGQSELLQEESVDKWV